MKKVKVTFSFVFCILTIFVFSHAFAKSAPANVAAKFELKLVKVCIEGKQVTINGVHNFGKTAAPEWSWGDGTKDKTMFPGKHLYKKPGTYKISLTMTEVTPSGTVVKVAKTIVLVQ